MSDLDHTKLELLSVVMKTLGSILYTENMNILNLIVDLDYYRRIEKVIKLALRQQNLSELELELVKDALWGLSNL